VNAGQLGLERPSLQRAHRVAFYLIHGRWPTPWGLHGCDNPSCCNAENPEHVHEGTPAQNQQEMWARGRQPAHLSPGETHARAALTNGEAAAIRAAYAAGALQEDLAAEFGVVSQTVSLVVRGRTYPDSAYVPPPPPRPRVKSSVRLTDAQRAEIRERYAAGGVKQAELAAEFDVTQATISQVVRYAR